MRKNIQVLWLVFFTLPCGGAQEGLPFVFKEVRRFDPKMKAPSGIAVDAKDRLYVAGKSGVKVFDAGGRLLRSIKTSDAATCVAADAQGNVYAGLRVRIEKFGADGKQVTAWGKEGKGGGEFRYVTGIAVSDSLVYVTDAGARRICRFAADGDYVDSIGKFLIPSPYFDCDVDANGILYVAHTGKHRIERYDRNSRLIGHWGQYGDAPENFTGCCNPTNFALFGDGRIVTAEKGIPRLKSYDASGKLLAHLGEEAFAEKAAGMDLAVDSEGRIALLDPLAGKIRFYELKPSGMGEVGIDHGGK